MNARGLGWMMALVIAAAIGCRSQPAARPPAPTASDDRSTLLRQIATLPEVAACRVDAGDAAAGIRLTAVDLAGEVASASFACVGVPIAGKVTFFRIAGRWMPSTRDIRRDGGPPARRAATF